MLVSLFLSNYIYIDKLTINFEKGLNVIIGESGSGKSIVIEGLLLALGAKLPTGSIARDQNSQMIFSAEFIAAPTHLASDLSDRGIDVSDSLVVRRVVSKDRKSKYYINDVPVAQDLIKHLNTALIEYTGQSANFALLDKSMHIKMLDTFACELSQLQAGRELYNTYKQLIARQHELHEKYDNIIIEQDYLRHAIKEISQLSYQDNEEAELVEKRKLLNDHKSLCDTIKKVYDFLEHADTTNSLIRLKKDLSKNSDYFDNTIAAIDQAIDSFDKIDHELTQVSEMLQFSEPLESVEDRLYKIRSIAKKYQTVPEQLSVKLAQFETEYNTIGNIDHEISEIAKRIEAHKTECVNLFTKVSSKRHEFAKLIEANVNDNLASLKLEKAQFRCAVTTDFDFSNFKEAGFDDVEFLFKTIPTKPFESLATVASGGELSRIVLALKLAFSGSSQLSTMIFDEIDTGISGQTAISVADKLTMLSTSVQLITITHQPYLAAKASNLIHFEKNSNDNNLTLKFKSLSDEEREIEIAKMISGDKISADTLSAAKSLINL